LRAEYTGHDHNAASLKVPKNPMTTRLSNLIPTGVIEFANDLSHRHTFQRSQAKARPSTIPARACLVRE